MMQTIDRVLEMPREDLIKYEQFRTLVQKFNSNSYDISQIVSENVTRVLPNVHGVLVKGWLNDWVKLSQGPLEKLFSVMLGTDEYSIEMRQNSPFTGVLSKEERVQCINRCRLVNRE